MLSANRAFSCKVPILLDLIKSIQRQVNKNEEFGNDGEIIVHFYSVPQSKLMSATYNVEPLMARLIWMFLCHVSDTSILSL
jgi:hypothetical protein